MKDPYATMELAALSVLDYVRGLRSILLHQYDLAMLQTHYHAPEHTITATQMARSVGFPTHRPAHLHYAQLAKRLGEKLGVLPDFAALLVLLEMRWPEGECEWIMRPQMAEALRILGWTGSHTPCLAEEVNGEDRFVEGAVFHVAVNAFERSLEARKQCITHHGAKCFICGFDFGQAYGPSFAGYIHAHHLKPLSEIGEEYVFDPVEDLRPVCPNCHAVLHSSTPPYSIDEVKALLHMQEHKPSDIAPEGEGAQPDSNPS